MRTLISFLAVFYAAVLSYGQSVPMIHSHNDYQKNVPFYMAYSCKAAVIECDLHYIGDTFFVGHDASDVDSTRTFENMYLEPLVTIFRCNGGCAWINDPDRKITLMAEIKSPDSDAYVDALEERLRAFPDVFDPDVNPHACGILITGWNFPSHPEKYPSFFKYDYQYNGVDWGKVTADEFGRIGSVSMNFGALSRWNGQGEFNDEERKAVRKVIDFAHSIGKPVRFWGAPDCEACWDMLVQMGADYISTDHIDECTRHFDRQNINQ